MPELLPLMLLAFLITIGVLVTVHEWGHFWVARRLGIKILRFSVGFGPALWKRRFGADDTEFVLAAVPLGGYVQMLDEREGEVAEEEAHRAFNRQSLKVRSAVVLAGPLANFVFAFFALMLLYMLGIPGPKPLVVDVMADSAAARAGFKAGDEILAVNDTATLRWQSVRMAAIDSVMAKTPLNFKIRNAAGIERSLHMGVPDFSLDTVSESGLLPNLGLRSFPIRGAKIINVTPDGAAQRGGLQVDDVVIGAAGQMLSDGADWAQIIQSHSEQIFTVEVERNGAVIVLEVTPDHKDGKGFLGISYQPDTGGWQPEIVKERYNPVYAAAKAVVEIKHLIMMSLRAMKMMLTLEISVKHISGPVTIAEVAGHSMNAGGISFLWFLAMISISLGFVNLLPIPVLDGGHLLTYLFEAIKGAPLSEQFQFALMRVGLALLIMLMGLALFNDINRLLH